MNKLKPYRADIQQMVLPKYRIGTGLFRSLHLALRFSTSPPALTCPVLSLVINLFMPNVFSHPYQLNEFISNFRVVGRNC